MRESHIYPVENRAMRRTRSRLNVFLLNQLIFNMHFRAAAERSAGGSADASSADAFAVLREFSSGSLVSSNASKARCAE
jgi:hypothetical protein